MDGARKVCGGLWGPGRAHRPASSLGEHRRQDGACDRLERGLGQGLAPDGLKLKTNLLPICSSKKAGATAKGKVGGRWK